jgi:hypothetical protein
VKPARATDPEAKPTCITCGNRYPCACEDYGIEVVIREASPARRKKLVRLLAMLLDKPRASEER